MYGTYGTSSDHETWRSRSRSRLVVALAVVTFFTISIATPLAPPAHAAPDDPFTIVVIPDTQGYTVSTEFDHLFDQQTQWIVDNSDDLNVTFAIQVGDLVESWPNVNQWERASRGMSILDDAGIPNSVLPGNHDLDFATGNSPPYDSYFPPSRYSAASWNSADASYGGYLGQNLFGPDPVDRQNKDNFALMTAGGMDFVIINLEFESPEYSLQWAQRVLDAYPERRAILATHGFIHTGGARSNTVVRTDADVKTANEVWNELVYQNCNIFMVVNGHWHDGDLGEANRTDPNSCGRPVHQILTDYQTRVNGGNGWLRYYTFTPSENTIDAYTYSPALGQFETDADSRFTLAYDMRPPGQTEDVTLIPGGAAWSWLNETTAWPAGWNSTSFDDTGWASGSAPLGFGSAVVVTNIDKPPPTSNRPRSILYRHQFTVADASTVSELTATTWADDGIVVWLNGVEIGRAGMAGGTVTSASYASIAPRTSAAMSAPVRLAVPGGILRSGANVVAISHHLNYRGTPDASFDLILNAVVETDTDPPPPPDEPEETTLIGSASNWRWLNEPTWPSQWNSTTFGDSAWRSGTAPLGFGSTAVTSNIDVPPPTSNRPRSVLFRHAFTVERAEDLSDISLTTRSDDGIIVYVNGSEVLRSNMPAGAASATTYATAAPRTSVAAANPITVMVPVALLRTGTNVVSASVHLNFRATPDVSFELTMRALRQVTAPPDDPPDPPVSTPVSLFTAAAPWAWRYENGSWPAGWNTTAFVDDAWARGGAVLGFGSTGLTTNIDKPPPTSNRPVSALFRTTFTVTDAAELHDIALTVRADDGVVVYVNGTEIGRTRVAAGPVSATSYATAAPRTSTASGAPSVFAVAAALLHDGVNTISASVHLNYRGTPDVSFIAALDAIRTTNAGQAAATFSGASSRLISRVEPGYAGMSHL